MLVCHTCKCMNLIYVHTYDMNTILAFSIHMYTMDLLTQRLKRTENTIIMYDNILYLRFIIRINCD